MARIDEIIKHLQFSISFSKRYYKQLHKYLDILNSFLAQFPDDHLWEETILTTLFAKTYTYIFNFVPACLPAENNTYYVLIDTIELNPSYTILLYPYRSVWEGISFRVENIPAAFLRIFNDLVVKQFSTPYVLSFRTGLFLGFHYYGPSLPYHLQAVTILCARALKVLKILKIAQDTYPFPSPRIGSDELLKYWQNIVAVINLFKGGEEDD